MAGHAAGGWTRSALNQLFVLPLHRCLAISLKQAGMDILRAPLCRRQLGTSSTCWRCWVGSLVAPPRWM